MILISSTIYNGFIRSVKTNFNVHFCLQIVEFLLNLKDVAGEGFDLNFTDTLQGETGKV